MTQAEFRRLAQIGAEIRLGQLQTEIEGIFKAFPELGERAPVAPSLDGGKRGRKKMSAAARRKIALAQKKRWAEWRAENGKAAGGTAVGTAGQLRVLDIRCRDGAHSGVDFFRPSTHVA
jgi:hypothetical protein